MKKIASIIMMVFVGSIAAAQTNDSIVEKTVQCAQSGNDVCQTLLGKWVFEGSHGYKQDYGKAVAWWMQAAKQNNDEATANLGFCYQFGWGVDADSATACRLFEKALKQGNGKLVKTHDSLAAKGSVFSAMLLGHCYKMAIGAKRDAALAAKYYKLAADHGNVEAMREAAILMRGNKDDASALALFKSAMQNGDVTSTYYYGLMHCEGRGTAKDAGKGMTYIRQAAEKGYAAAQFELAEAYAKGNGVAQDGAMAVEWYKKAAVGGSRASWWKLAECYREGVGTPVDYEQALELYAKASEEGYHNKLRHLLTDDDSEWNKSTFMHYLRGMRLLEVDNNPNAAMKEFGNLPKQMTVRQEMEALCMMHPSFAKRNVKKATKQLQKLADAGSRRASFEVALLLLKDKDSAKAEKMLNELAKQGYARAINYLADCYYEGRELKQDKPRATLLYLQAEQIGMLSATGASRLSQAFRNGDGMKANASRAEELDKYRAANTKALLEKVK